MMDYTTLSYAQLRQGYLEKKFRPSDVIQAYLKRMDDLQYLNVYIYLNRTQALEAAALADQRVEAGDLRPLEGYPLAVKDNFAMQGYPMTACSNILKTFKPFYDSTITQRLMGSGAIVLGMTNMDEFAMGSSTENSIYGPAINPWKSGRHSDTQYSPGGSSGGSSAAVAARMALGALGTDTGGSIRQPAAFCGLVGLKPTYGRCSRYGVIAFASSLDQAGPITQTVQDSIDLFEVMSGVDEKDSTTANLPPFKFKREGSLEGLKIGMPKEFLEVCTNEEVKSNWLNTAKVMESMGATLQEVSLPHLPQSLPTYYIIAPAEASSNLARYDGIRYGVRHEGDTLEETYVKSRTKGFGEEVKRRIMVGTFVLSSEAYEDFYIKGLKVRNMIAHEIRKSFESVDLLLTPTTPSAPFALGDKVSNPMEMYYSDYFTVAANLSGNPAISIPVGVTKEGLPLGVQLVADSFKENLMLNAALDLEAAFDFKTQLLQDVNP